MPEFTRNWTKHFSANIKTLKERGISIESYLEVGIFEGRSAFAMKREFPHASYTGIDSWEFEEASLSISTEAELDEVRQRAAKNLSELSHSRFFRGRAIPELMKLHLSSEKFDFVYIDGSHHMYDVNLESAIAWSLLEIGGILLWDDAKNSSRKSTKTGISAFLSTVPGCFEVVLSGSLQFSIKKTRREAHQIDFREASVKST